MKTDIDKLKKELKKKNELLTLNEKHQVTKDRKT